MKAAIVAMLIAAMTLSGREYRPSHPPPLGHHLPKVPPKILWGVAFAESSFDPLAISRDGFDCGLFQLRAHYNIERGVANAFDPVEATRHAEKILAQGIAELGLDGGIASYRQGIRGVRRFGIERWYVDRVKGVYK